jgi:hypothetical protein
LRLFGPVLKWRDVELADKLGHAGFRNCKLGGFCRSGRTVVTCNDPVTCAVDCAPDVVDDPDAPGYDWLAVCGGFSDQPRPALGELLWTRARARSATVDCRSWRTPAGLDQITGCSVIARR